MPICMTVQSPLILTKDYKYRTKSNLEKSRVVSQQLGDRVRHRRSPLVKALEGGGTSIVVNRCIATPR
jgi:hypothetical protein